MNNIVSAEDPREKYRSLLHSNTIHCTTAITIRDIRTEEEEELERIATRAQKVLRWSRPTCIDGDVEDVEEEEEADEL